jgi:dual specificity MAP kinase phosphatase
MSLAEITALVKDEPPWFAGLDGSFPSRITDCMYLGNLTHANNPSLLKALGITQILSVGETAMWRDGELEEWGTDNVCLVQGVQDNGIDPLTNEFERCLDFIGKSLLISLSQGLRI